MTSLPALIIIDIQFDFLKSGALEVPEGNRVIKPIMDLAPDFKWIVATQDWHPAGHKSFASSHGLKPFETIDWQGQKQVLWPDHCIQNSKGAIIHPDIQALHPHVVIQKGTDPEIDSYSAFFDNQRKKKTELDHWLKERNITELVITGLATDFCVKWTVLDGLSLGYKVKVVKSACRGINSDLSSDWNEMEKAGAILLV